MVIKIICHWSTTIAPAQLQIEAVDILLHKVQRSLLWHFDQLPKLLINIGQTVAMASMACMAVQLVQQYIKVYYKLRNDIRGVGPAAAAAAGGASSSGASSGSGGAATGAHFMTMTLTGVCD